MFMEPNDTVMTLGMIDTNTMLYQSRECVGNVHSTSTTTETVTETLCCLSVEVRISTCNHTYNLSTLSHSKAVIAMQAQ